MRETTHTFDSARDDGTWSTAGVEKWRNVGWKRGVRSEERLEKTEYVDHVMKAQEANDS